MVSIICYTNNTRTLEHSYFTSSQLLRQDNSSITIFQSTDDILSGSFYLVCTHLCSRMSNWDNQGMFTPWTMKLS
jgi:hypothetical protein